jgi:hypothetical protein
LARGYVDTDLLLGLGALALVIAMAVGLAWADCRAGEGECQKNAALLQLEWRFEGCGCRVKVGDWWVLPRSIEGEP